MQVAARPVEGAHRCSGRPEFEFSGITKRFVPDIGPKLLTLSLQS
jgi:hypothetical protein